MKLQLSMTRADDTKATKNFDNIADTKTDANLKLLANGYIKLTDAKATVAKKIVTTVIDLD